MSSPAPPAPPASPGARRRSSILIAGCVAVVGLVAAIAFVAGSATRSAAPAATGPSVAAAAPAGHAGHGGDGLELYAVQAGVGTVVTDGEGRLLYGSDQDGSSPPASHCTGACAQEWQPLVVAAGEEPDLLGVAPSVVGRVVRDDGSSQLTLGGWPVYVNGSDDGTLKSPVTGASGWFAISPQGKKVSV